MKLARPSFQKFFHAVFRLNLGFLGYMNWSPDFRLTGEKLALEKLKDYKICSTLDIGANKGQWAEMAIDTLGCKVISIEPQKSAVFDLSLLVDKHKGRLVVFNLALGSQNKNVDMNIHNSSSELSFIDPRLKDMPLLKGKQEKVENVKMTTLDLLYRRNLTLFRNIDLVKIDTEGYELDVLKGGLKFLKEVKPKFIQLEMNWHQLFLGYSLINISQLIPKYKIYKILPSGSCFYGIDPTLPINNLFQLSNFMFVRPDINLANEKN